MFQCVQPRSDNPRVLGCGWRGHSTYQPNGDGHPADHPNKKKHRLPKEKATTCCPNCGGLTNRVPDGTIKKGSSAQAGPLLQQQTRRSDARADRRRGKKHDNKPKK